MKIECRTDNEKHERTYLIEGELDVHEVKTLKSNLLADLEKGGEWSFIIDFTGVKYLDSSGLGMLVYLKKTIDRQGGKLLIVHLNEQVKNVFKLTKLESYFGLSLE